MRYYLTKPNVTVHVFGTFLGLSPQLAGGPDMLHTTPTCRILYLMQQHMDLHSNAQDCTRSQTRQNYACSDPLKEAPASSWERNTDTRTTTMSGKAKEAPLSRRPPSRKRIAYSSSCAANITIPGRFLSILSNKCVVQKHMKCQSVSSGAPYQAVRLRLWIAKDRID